MSAVLALDLATNTGYAYRGPFGDVRAGVFSCGVTRLESPGMRFLKFSRWLRSLIQQAGITCVCFEAPHHRGGASTTVAVGLATHVMSVCAELSVEHFSVHTQQLKKFATGKGNASKEDMIEALGMGAMDDNEADARWILIYAEKELGIDLARDETTSP